MSLLCRRVLTPIVCAGLLIGYGSLAVNPASAATIQEDHDVEVHEHKHDSDVEAKVEVVVVQDDYSNAQDIIKKLKKAREIKIHRHDSDTDENVEVIVLGADGSDHEGLLKKLKSNHKVQIHKRHSDGDENVEVIVLGEDGSGHEGLLKKLKSDHKGRLLKLHAGSAVGESVFVINSADIQDADVEVDFHHHVAELIHEKASGKLDNKALANKLRQIADQLEAGNNEPHTAHDTHRDIEIHAGGEHKFHIEKRDINKKTNHAFEFKTDSGKHVVIGKPGASGKMVIELRSDSGEQHDHGDHKEVIVLGKGHDADHNVVVDVIHVDGDRDPGALAQTILKRVQEQNPKLNLKVEKIFHEALKHDGHAHPAPAGDGKTSNEGLSQTLEDLKQELDGLRRELDQLQSDRPVRKSRAKK